MNHGRSLEKVVGSQRRKKTRAAAGRKHMIGSGEIIPERRRRIRTDEYGPGVLNGICPVERPFYNQFDVLRSDGVGEVKNLLTATRDNDGAVFLKGLRRDRASFAGSKLRFDRFFYLGGNLR